MLGSLLIVLAGAVVLACVLTPLIFSGLAIFLTPFPWPFSRVFDRTILLTCIVMVALQWRTLRQIAWGELLPSMRTGRARLDLLTGFILTVVGSLVAIQLFTQFEILQWSERSVEFYLSKSGKILISAAVISVIEELFFRGLLLSALLQVVRPWLAVGISSVVYAVVHFFSPIKNFSYVGYDPIAGFWYLEQLFERFLLAGTIQGVLGLTLVGIVLGVAMLRTRSLWLCIGLHFGWIFSVKISGAFMDKLPHIQFPAGTGARYFLVSHPFGWVGIVLVALMLAVVLMRRKAEKAQ